MNLLSVIAQRNRLDPLTVAFKAASGATDVAGIDAIVRYVRGQGLLSNFRLYPMKPAQNASSGSTVYGIGSLTANNMTLVGSPTLDASGINFNGTSQYGSIADFIGSETLTVFSDITQASATPSTVQVIWSMGDSGALSRFLNLNGALAGDPYLLARYADGVSPYTKQSAGGLSTASRQTLVAQYIAGGDMAFWQNKVSRSLTLLAGTPNTSAFDATANTLVGAILPSSPTNFYAGKMGSIAFMSSSITTDQREAITDLISAL